MRTITLADVYDEAGAHSADALLVDRETPPSALPFSFVRLAGLSLDADVGVAFGETRVVGFGYTDPFDAELFSVGGAGKKRCLSPKTRKSWRGCG